MFHQKATETVTLSRTQLQAILELITQIGGISRSESWNEPKNGLKTENSIKFKDMNEMQNKDNQSLDINNYWEKEDLMSRSDWYSNKNNTEQMNQNSSFMLNNRLLSASLSDCSKAEEMRGNSVMTNDTNESNFRRYARINDSEFDWNELHRKRTKALEYSRALALQHEEKKKKKLEEQQRIKAEEQLLDKRIEEQRNRMQKDFELEQKLMEEKRVLAEMKREAVIAAIERTEQTPVIRKRNFLVDNESEPQPQPAPALVTVAAIKPQTRTRDRSAQTERQTVCPQYCESGTQTDVQLLLYLLNEMKFMSKTKPKLISKSTENLTSDSNSSVRAVTPKIMKKRMESKSGLNQIVSKKVVLTQSPQLKGLTKNSEKYLNQKSLEKEKRLKQKEIKSVLKNQIRDKSMDELKTKTDEVKHSMDAFRCNSLAHSSSVHNITELDTQRIMSSIVPKTKLNFLPDISSRPHSRKKWYSQQTFDPNFLT